MLIIKFAILLRLAAEVLPGAQNATDALCHACYTGPLTGFGSAGDHVLDLGIRPLDRAEVATSPRRVDRAHEIKVRRHERSIHGLTSRCELACSSSRGAEVARKRVSGQPESARASCSASPT